MSPEAEEQPRPVRMGILHRPSRRSEQVDSYLRSLWAQACPAWGHNSQFGVLAGPPASLGLEGGAWGLLGPLC